MDDQSKHFNIMGKKRIFKCGWYGKVGPKNEEKQANMTKKEKEISFVACTSNEHEKSSKEKMKRLVDSGSTNHIGK